MREDERLRALALDTRGVVFAEGEPGAGN